MKGPLEHIRQYVGWSHTEYRGAKVLLMVLLLIAVFPDVHYYFFGQQHDKDVVEQLPLETPKPQQQQASSFEKGAPSGKKADEKQEAKPETAHLQAEKSPDPINLNKAEAGTLQQINGIGPVLSKRIVKFRESLGGFYSAHQLYEVYGLDSSVATRLIKQAAKTQLPPTTKVDVKKASFKQLLSHPYINYEQTKVICNMRDTCTLKNVHQLHAVDTTINANQLQPYLDF